MVRSGATRRVSNHAAATSFETRSFGALLRMGRGSGCGAWVAARINGNAFSELGVQGLDDKSEVVGII
jgi:hypothetical protein